MDGEIIKYKKLYPNLDALMIETILMMSEEQHVAFQAKCERKEYGPAPETFILPGAITVEPEPELIPELIN